MQTSNNSMRDGMTSERMHSSQFGVSSNLNVKQFKIISPKLQVQSN